MTTNRDNNTSAAAALLISQDEAARLLGVCSNTVANLRRRGLIGSVKIGARRMYILDDLREFVQRRREVRG